MELRKTKVLLIDDNREEFVIIRGMLSKMSPGAYDLDWEIDYDKGRSAIERGEYDVYLVDFRLGPHCGLELIRENAFSHPRRPMILLTAHGTPEVDHQALRNGASDYIPKGEMSPTLLDRAIRHSIERLQLQEKLYYQATHDELTGLFNRQHLLDLLGAALSSARRHDYPLSLSLCDVDLFKSINDHHGHAAGDEVLAFIGRIFSERMRNEDIPGRYGGDEFCLVFPYATPEDAAISLDRMRERIQEKTFHNEDGVAFSTTVTFGVAAYQKDMNAADLIAAADRALYEAKDAGRNRTHILS